MWKYMWYKVSFRSAGADYVEYLVKVLLRAEGFPAGDCLEREWLILTYCTVRNLLPCSSPVIYFRCLTKDLNGLVD